MVKVPPPASTSLPVCAPVRPGEPHHQPELDGIRGIALLAAMLSHGGPYIARDTFAGKVLAYAMIPG